GGSFSEITRLLLWSSRTVSASGMRSGAAGAVAGVAVGRRLTDAAAPAPALAVAVGPLLLPGGALAGGVAGVALGALPPVPRSSSWRSAARTQPGMTPPLGCTRTKAPLAWPS